MSNCTVKDFYCTVCPSECHLTVTLANGRQKKADAPGRESTGASACIWGEGRKEGRKGPRMPDG